MITRDCVTCSPTGQSVSLSVGLSVAFANYQRTLTRIGIYRLVLTSVIVLDGVPDPTTIWCFSAMSDCWLYHFHWLFTRARIIGIATCLSVCLSVRPSVTRRYRVKTKKASVMISSPSGSRKTLVFWRQISSPNSNGFPPNVGLKEGWGVKIQRFSSFKRQYLENGSRYGQSYY